MCRVSKCTVEIQNHTYCLSDKEINLSMVRLRYGVSGACATTRPRSRRFQIILTRWHSWNFVARALSLSCFLGTYHQGSNFLACSPLNIPRGKGLHHPAISGYCEGFLPLLPQTTDILRFN